MPLSILTATAGDRAQILEMMRGLYASGSLALQPDALPALDMLLADPSLGRCFLIREAEKSIGYFVIGFGFSLEFGGKDAFLDELYIVPEARSRGVGKVSLQFATDFCRASGVHSLHLEVARENLAAQRLYRRAGFQERHADFDLLTLRDIQKT